MHDPKPLIPIEEQFKIMANTAPVLIWMSGTDKLCYFFNEGWLRFTGRTPEQEYGNGWAEGVHPDDLNRCLYTYTTSFDARQEYKMEFRLKRHDGQYRWLVNHGVPRYAADGLFVGFIGSCMDIDELVESQKAGKDFISAEALKNEQALNQELSASNEEFASVNEELRQMQESLETLNNELEERVALRTEALTQSEAEQQALNEELSATVEELASANEELVTTNEELQAAHQDIQEKINELAISEHRIRSMVNSAPFPIGVYIGREMRIRFANQSIMDVWGKGNDVVGKLYSEILPELENQLIFGQLDSVFTTGVPFHARNQPLNLVIDGASMLFYFNYSFTPLYDLNGEIYGVMNTAADVTDLALATKEIERNEAELKITQKRLEAELEAGKKVQRQKDDFIGMASHELKTPLTSLTAIIQVLNSKLKNNEDAFISGALDKANTQVKKMSTLINGFLNISRLESGKILIDKQNFLLDELINELINEVQLTTTSHTIQFDNCGTVEIFADRDKIGSVLSNLLSNAIKYAPKSEYIHVKCAVLDQHVRISVRDEGIGVGEQDLEKLFDRYYRVEASNTKHIAGFGIGLYLSAEIVKQHGGTIWAESEKGNGSTFYFELPLA